MTGFAQKLSAFAVAVALSFGLASMPLITSAFAQDEAQPEATPIAEPYAQPTEFSPITAGDAERGAPASATAEATLSATVESTPVPSPSPTEAATATESPATAAPMPTDTPGPWNRGHSTISKERPATAGRRKQKAAPAFTAATPNASPSASTAASPPESKTSKAQVVPENSPFAGMNFGNSKGPTNIKSDSLNLDYQNKAIFFTGHVHAVQGAGDLTSDKLKVQYGQNFNDIKMTYADGNVRMSQGTRWITSDHAVLDQGKHLLRFLGNPVVHDGEDQITGSLITVDLVSGKSTVENPRVVIFPKESKNPDNESSPETP